ncbi:MAG: hypothetical protein QOI20_238 [Acidimicrobiaceae bacterium]|jgi:DNA-binding NarL/FixJ family response regulator|nr:hypothetical protein [Acidimicrobiaceae bacterium]
MSTVLLLGRPGLRTDLIAHLLAQAGVEVRVGFEGAGAAGAGGAVAGARQAVAVLVDPLRPHWAAARAAGKGVVLVADPGAQGRDMVAAMLRGADAVIEADVDAATMVEAIEVVAAGGAVVTPALVRPLLDAAREDADAASVRLTRRELDILRSIDEGHTVKQTARALGITIKTVENLQSRMFRKLEARNRAQAITRAHALRLLDRDPV